MSVLAGLKKRKTLDKVKFAKADTNLEKDKVTQPSSDERIKKMVGQIMYRKSGETDVELPQEKEDREMDEAAEGLVNEEDPEKRKKYEDYLKSLMGE
jgi:hypothetical protein